MSTGPTWSEMKLMTDKDMRRKQKERDRVRALEQEALDKVSTRNKLIFWSIMIVSLISITIAWFMVQSRNEEISKIKELSTLRVTRPNGAIRFRETTGMWTTEARNLLAVNEGIGTTDGGAIDLMLQKGQVLTLQPNTDLIVQEIAPLPDMKGINITLMLEKGSVFCEMADATGYVKIKTEFLMVKLNPGVGAEFKIEQKSAGGKTVVRVASKVGTVMVKYKTEPAINLTGRKAIEISADGKLKGPATILPANEAWR